MRRMHFSPLLLAVALFLASCSPLAPMPTARERATSAAVGGRILIMGGYDGSNYLPTVEMYIP